MTNTCMTSKCGFMASLALNIFLVGFIAGHYAGMIHMPFMHNKNNHGYKEKELVEFLPQEKQQEALTLIHKIKLAHLEHFSKDKEMFKEVEKTIVAKDFDKKKFLEEMRKLNSSMDTIHVESEKMIAEFLSGLNQKERESLLEKFNEMHKHKLEKHHKFLEKIEGEVKK